MPQSYRSHRSSGLGFGGLTELTEFRVRYGSVTELTEVPGIVARAYRTHIRYKNDIPVPRVLVALAYRTSRSSGYGYECPTELTEVLCRVIPGVNTPGMVCAYPTEPNLGIVCLVLCFFVCFLCVFYCVFLCVCVCIFCAIGVFSFFFL